MHRLNNGDNLSADVFEPVRNYMLAQNVLEEATLSVPDKQKADYYANVSQNCWEEVRDEEYAVVSHIEEFYKKKNITRRTNSVISICKLMQKELGAEFPKMPIEKHFITFNATYPCTSYEEELVTNQHAVGVALWMLDRLYEHGLLEKASIYLFYDGDDNELPDDVFVPCDSVFDKETIAAMLHLIYYRNGKPSSCENLFSEDSRNLIRKSFSLPPTDDKLTVRQRFDAVMSLIPHDDICKAIEEYKTSAVEYFRRVIQFALPEREKAIKLANIIIKQSEMTVQSISRPISRSGLVNTSMSYTSECKRLASKLESCMCAEYRDIVSNAAWLALVDSTCDTNFLRERYDERLPIREFEVDDPFSCLFAIFYFFETDNDWFWCTPLNLLLFTQSGFQLPWGGESTPEPDDEETETVSENFASEDVFENLSAERIFYEAECDMDIRRSLYSCRHSFSENPDASPDKISAAQTIFTRSGIVPPRNSADYFKRSRKIKSYSFADDAEFIATCLTGLSYLTLNGKVSAKPSSFSIPDLPAEENVPEDDISNDADDLLAENSRLKEELSRLKSCYKAIADECHDAQRSIKEKDKQLFAMEEEKASLKAMISEFESIVYADDEETEENPIEFPYTVKGRYVVFGGHASFLRRIKQLLPNVRFVSPDTKANQQLIYSADAIWIQSNAISHSDFNPIIDKARLLDKPFEYFGYASADKCARQLIKYDIEHNN